MAFKQVINPLTGKFDLVSDSATSANVAAGSADGDLLEWDVAGNEYVVTNDISPDSVTFNTGVTTSAERKLRWDADAVTLAFGVPDGEIQLGQEVHDYLTNLSGGDVVNGDVVSAYGVSGNRQAFTLTDATDHDLSVSVLGVVTVPTIANNNTGRITFRGNVSGLNTDALTEGLPIYVDPANPGKWTNVRPVMPDHAIYVGVCLVKSATVGVINANPRYLNNATTEVTKEPTGFDVPENVVVSYDSTTRKITLTGSSWNAYYEGEHVSALISGWVSDAHPATLDKRYFLVYNGSAFVWKEIGTDTFYFYDLLIAYVDHGTSDKFGLRECHGLMPWQTHHHLHDSIGTFKYSGGILGGYTLDSTTAADRRPTVSESIVYDEDLKSTITAFTAANYTQFFLSSADTANFTKSAADIVPVSTSQPYWNEFSGGTWGQTLMSNNYYAAMFVLQVPTTADAGSLPYRTIFVQAQSEYLTLTGAQAVTTNDINLGELTTLAPESVFIAKIIIRYTGGDWKLIQVDAITGNRQSQATSPTGSYLASVSTDDTLTGSGTVSDPLSVAVTAVVKSSTQTLTSAEVTNTLVNNYGQTVANTLTLPTAGAGMNFICTVGTSGAGALNIKAGPSDKIYLDGTALDDGDKVNNATPAVGDAITFLSFQTGASTYDWIARTSIGTWIDGGA